MGRPGDDPMGLTQNNKKFPTQLQRQDGKIFWDTEEIVF
jgi:hypothetical protein